MKTKEEKIDEAWEDYHKAEAPLRKDYEKAIAPLWDDHEKAEAPLWEAYIRERTRLGKVLEKRLKEIEDEEIEDEN
jgi:hypothetical protein